MVWSTENTSHQSILIYYFLLFVGLSKYCIFQQTVVSIGSILLKKKTTGQQERRRHIEKRWKRTKTIFTLVFFTIEMKMFFKEHLTRFSPTFIVQFLSDSHVILSKYKTGYYCFYCHYYISWYITRWMTVEYIIYKTI